MALTSAQQKQLASIKTQALALQKQLAAKVAAESAAKTAPVNTASTTRTTTSGGSRSSSLPYDTNALVAQSRAMLEQTRAQGSTPFAGSSYSSSAKTNAPQAPAPTQSSVPTPPSYSGNIPQPKLQGAPNLQSFNPMSYTPYNPSTSNADQYFQQLMASMTPTSEENDVTDQQAALESQLRNLNQGQGVMNQNLADQPIALPFIAGQQSAVENRYALQRSDVQGQQLTLEKKLANLQARRQSAIDVAKTGVDYGQNKDSRNDSLNQSNFANSLNVNQYNSGLIENNNANARNRTNDQNQLAQQQYENQLNQSRYGDTFNQQRYENQVNSQRYGDTQAQQQYENSTNASRYADQQQQAVNSSTPKTSNGPTTTARVSSTPVGGYDSSAGVNFNTAPKKTLLTSVQSMFAPAMSTKIQASLTDEQLRLFMNDYTETQNQQQQSINPEWYLSEWKKAAGIGQSSSSARSI